MSSRTLWRLMTFLALAIAVYALVLLAVPTGGAPFIPDRLATVPVAMLTHIAASAVALAVGPFQFHTRLRATRLSLHRWLGRLYLLAVVAGGVSGFRLALVSDGGVIAHTGFALLALGWLVSARMAYVRVRAGDIVGHRAWMVRSYALTFAAVTLRLYLPLGIVAGLSFETTYQGVSWLAWLGNLIVAERWLVARRGQQA